MTFHESLRKQRPGRKHPEKISHKSEISLNHAKSSRNRSALILKDLALSNISLFRCEAFWPGLSGRALKMDVSR